MTALIVICAVMCIACGKQDKNDNSVSESPAVPSGTAPENTAAAVSGGSLSGTAVTGADERKDRSIRYAQQIAAGLFDEVYENLADTLAAQLDKESLQASWKSVAEGAGIYEGIIGADQSVDGENPVVLVTLGYRQNRGRTIRFVYDAQGKIVGIWFDTVSLDGEADTVRWSEEEITIGRDPYILQGRITIPSEGRAPIVILIADSEYADMDGTMGEASSKPLRDIAYGLADQGIASVRYNRRCHQYDVSVTADDSLFDTLYQDVWYAVDQMYNDRRIDTSRIYLLAMGRSADYLPAMVKKKARRLSGAVMMAAKPVRVTEQYYSRKGKDITSDAAYFINENSTFPLLVLQGEADTETGMADYEYWKTLWQGRSHVTYHSYQRLNHYFMASAGKNGKKEYDAGGSVSPSVIEDIAQWCESTAG